MHGYLVSISNTQIYVPGKGFDVEQNLIKKSIEIRYRIAEHDGVHIPQQLPTVGARRLQRIELKILFTSISCDEAQRS